MADNPPFSGHPIDLDATMASTTDEINRALTVIRPNEPPESRFMVVSDNLCDLLLETAKAHLTRAENNLKRVELEVATIRERSRRAWEEMQAYNRELDEYGVEAINIHERFLKKGNSK